MDEQMTKDTAPNESLQSWRRHAVALTVRCIWFGVHYFTVQIATSCQFTASVGGWLGVNSFAFLSRFRRLFLLLSLQHCDNVMMSKIMLANAYNWLSWQQREQRFLLPYHPLHSIRDARNWKHAIPWKYWLQAQQWIESRTPWYCYI